MHIDREINEHRIGSGGFVTQNQRRQIVEFGRQFLAATAKLLEVDFEFETGEVNQRLPRLHFSPGLYVNRLQDSWNFDIDRISIPGLNLQRTVNMVGQGQPQYGDQQRGGGRSANDRATLVHEFNPSGYVEKANESPERLTCFENSGGVPND